MSLRGGFLAELCREHGDEIAFLRQRRVLLMDQPFVSLRLLADTEERLAAHLEGMVVEPEPLPAVIQRLAAGDEPSERYAALRALGRSGARDEFWEVFAATDWQNPAHAAAASDALNDAASARWSASIEARLNACAGAEAAALARAIGTLRLPLGEKLARVAAQAAEGLETFLWALGRLADAPARGLLYRHVQHGSPRLRQAAALALLGLSRERELLRSLERWGARESWASIPLALGGGDDVVSILSPLLERPPASGVDPDAVLALGLVGSVSAISLLLSTLTTPELAEVSAAALHLITGAQLQEEVVTIDEDTLDPEELAALREGRLEPRRVGTTAIRLSRRPEVWREWWRAAAGRFAAGIRYRLGRPIEARRVHESLLSTALPRRVRDLVASEIRIRHGVHLEYLSDRPVAEQHRAITQAAAALAAQTPKPGGWEFASTPAEPRRARNES